VRNFGASERLDFRLTSPILFRRRKLVSYGNQHRYSAPYSTNKPAKMDNLNLPVIDIGPFATAASQARRVVQQVREALSEVGFMYVRGHGIPPAIIRRAEAASRQFFAQPALVKDRFAYRHDDLEANFGFHGLEVERLDPTSAPDLKESFSMRNAPAVTRADRWPGHEFRSSALALYEASLLASYRIMKVMAAGLDLPSEFFTERHRGQNVTLRFLHYPARLPVTSADQLGAGAHTDYGSITLLHQDDVGGLEVLGADGHRHCAPAVPDALLVNTGDLMQQWTNDRFRSTVHQVRPIDGLTDRYSIAFFVDPDTDVRVECIESCKDGHQPPRYAPVTAGEHIQAKIAASQNVRTAGGSAASMRRSD
jgi:isopenicillin N synthase-like dioxygenase